MNELAFWQQKLIQFFHDPPGKPFTGTAKTGKHSVVAQALFEAFQRFNTHDRRKLRYIYKSADWAAAGADRSMLYVPRGMSGLGTVRWPSAPVITHPLSAGCKLEIDLQARPAEAPEAEDGDAEDEHEAAADETRDPLKEQQEVSSKLSTLVPDWSDPAKLREGFITLWRRWREDLCERGGGTAYRGDALWEEMPAETRSPDHSIWDHLKVVTALAFMLPHKMYQAPRDEGSREPWMLRFTLGPVQEFIDHSRTSRDLWISSFLLADLAWHAMQVFVEAYGPDCIVYPDLRGNPRADCWLAEHHAIALGEGDQDARRNPSSFAAVLPNACVALVPRGGEDAEVLQPLEQLAAKAQDAVTARWQELAALVRAWFEKLEPEPGCPTFDAHCASIWERQQQQAPVRCAWTAVPWLHMGRIASAAHLRGPALPAQGEHGAAPGTPQAREDHAVLDARRRRLAAWIPKDVWAHYELAREAFARSRLDYHQMERGFDYALTHHMLGVRHTLRKASDTTPLQGEEGGEKCTLCGMREALCGGEPARARGLDGRRAQARAFWRHSKLDPDGSGGERLCAICATKRFLVVADKASADGKLGKFNRLWAGAAAESYEVADRDGEVRVPFPSTATIAAQGFLERVVTKPDYAQEVAALVQACRAAGLPRTSFPRALPRLAAAAHATKGAAAALLEYEAEDVVYPETADARREAELARGNADTDKYLKLRDAINKLMRKARDIKDPAQPRKQIAVVRMDGDSIGQLLLGTPGAIGARWRDVLHPKVVERLKDNNYLNQAGWAALIDSKRLMGPSLHAFVSRALGQFSHCIVPWVVEREFSGRLIYAGGDDLLCIVPADEALDLTARLQQLFSAAWVVDTGAPKDLDQWAWRRRDWQGTYDQTAARGRFVIPLPGEGADSAIRLCRDGQRVAAHPADAALLPDSMRVDGRLLPMLGRAASLSAGIAIAHYKTPLSVLLRRSRELLDLAKEPYRDNEAPPHVAWRGRRGLALGHASRGGEKTRFALPWSSGEAGAIDAQRNLKLLAQAFGEGRLPGRLPYKLRELALTARCALERVAEQNQSADAHAQAHKMLLGGLLRQCLEGDGSEEIFAAALSIWQQGIDLACGDEGRYTDGLLLCRQLGRGESGADDEGDQ